MANNNSGQNYNSNYNSNQPSQNFQNEPPSGLYENNENQNIRQNQIGQNQTNNWHNGQQNTYQNTNSNFGNSNNSNLNDNYNQAQNEFINSQNGQNQFGQNNSNLNQNSNQINNQNTNFNNPNFDSNSGQNTDNYNGNYSLTSSPDINSNLPNNSNSYFQIGEPQVVIVEKKVEPTAAWKIFFIAKWWLILLIVLGLTLSFVGVYVVFNQKPAEQIGTFNNVAATIEAPQTLAKGIPETWKIIIENKENTAIQQLEIRLTFDKSFEFIKAISPTPDVPRGDIYKIARLDPLGQGISQAIIEIQGTTKGNIDEEIVMTGQVSYTPDKLIALENAGQLPSGQKTRRTISTTTVRTRTTAAQVTIDMNPTNQVVQNGGEAEMNITFANTSEREIRDLKVRMNYPDKGAFVYTGSELISSSTEKVKNVPDDSNNIWFIPNLSRLQKQTLKVRGVVTGADSVKLTFSADLGIRSGNDYPTINSATKDVTIATQPILSNTTIEGKSGNAIFRPGEVLNIVINYENKGTVPLRNVEIFGFVEDPAGLLDWTQAQFVGGDRGNLNNNTVQWRGSNVNQLVNLGTQVKGQVRYSVKVKDSQTFLQTGRKQNDYIIIPKVQIRADNLQQIEFAGNTYKSQGGLTFEQKITDRGPEPGQTNKRRFNVIWTFKTLQNQVNEVVVNTRTSLPPNTWVQSSITPISRVPELNYDPKNGNISWTPNKIPSYTGISSPIVTIGFDLIVEVQSNSNFGGINLFEVPKISGTDEVTNQRYDQDGQAGTTR
jgi:hypothetical protein